MQDVTSLVQSMGNMTSPHFPTWVWVKIKPPYGPQVLVHVSIYQGKDSILGFNIFLTTTATSANQKSLGSALASPAAPRPAARRRFRRLRPERRLAPTAGPRGPRAAPHLARLPHGPKGAPHVCCFWAFWGDRTGALKQLSLGCFFPKSLGRAERSVEATERI